MKQKLLTVITASQAREGDLDAISVDGPADPTGRWTARDHLAHVAWWRARDAALLDALMTGGALPPSVEDDAQNAEIYAANRGRKAADVKADARASWERLAAAVEASSEDVLERPHPYAPQYRLWEMIAGDAYQHLGEHLVYCHLESGDHAKAEAAQAWVCEVVDSLFADPDRSAVAKYNMACFYAKLGRATEAVPLLRESFQGAPRLVAHARTDTDLDPIRGAQEVRDLLAI